MSGRSSRRAAVVLWSGLLVPGPAMSDMAQPLLRHAPSKDAVWTFIAKIFPDRFIVLDDDAVEIRRSCKNGVYAYKSRERTLDARRLAFDESACNHFAQNE